MEEAPKSIFHVCYVAVTYRVEARARKWLTGVNATPGQKQYRDKILINEISAAWAPGQTHTFYARHEDTITPYGHRVRLVPVSAEEIAALAAADPAFQVY